MSSLIWAAQHWRAKIAEQEQPPVVGSTRELLKHLKPGDIFVSGPEPIKDKSLGARVFGRLYQKGYKLLQGEAAHTGVYVGDGKIIEARYPSGVRHRRLSSALSRMNAEFIRPDASTAERTSVANKLKEMATNKHDYAYASTPFFLKVVARLALPDGAFDDSHKEDLERNKVMCSNLVSSAYEGVVDFNANKPVGYITPKDIAESSAVKPIVRYRARKAWKP